jgi:hypothetical protein
MRGRQERDDLSRQLAETQAQVAQLDASLRETAERDPVTGLLSEPGCARRSTSRPTGRAGAEGP